MAIRKVAEGAYFVTSYSTQTVVGFNPNLANQGILLDEAQPEEDTSLEQDSESTKDTFTKALKKVSRRVHSKPS